MLVWYQSNCPNRTETCRVILQSTPPPSAIAKLLEVVAVEDTGDVRLPVIVLAPRLVRSQPNRPCTNGVSLDFVRYESTGPARKEYAVSFGSPASVASLDATMGVP